MGTKKQRNNKGHLSKQRAHSASAHPPGVVTGYEHHNYARRDDRYQYIGKNEETGEPMFLDYGRVVKYGNIPRVTSEGPRKRLKTSKKNSDSNPSTGATSALKPGSNRPRVSNIGVVRTERPPPVTPQANELDREISKRKARKGLRVSNIGVVISKRI
eukprot:Nitzschia sp. Nitz4//scaffold139_size61406//60454//60927//NITZ4_006469-RA/size61406-processed-gene-0.90-mRNA-1//-1//CDS//3329535879//7335//frame0